MIATEDGEAVLAGEDGDPEIVGGYGVAEAFEFGANGGVGIGGETIHVEDAANADQFG